MFYPDSINTVESAINTFIFSFDSHVWMFIALFEGVCIITLLLILLSHNKHTEIQKRFKEEAKKGDVDYNNIITSSFHAEDLYNKLKKACHPDKFTSNPELMTKANDLFQQITQNKYDWEKLQELKLTAIKELHINI